MTQLAVRELPLFPLPDVVLFPQEVLPLHIFEPRYRMMLRTVLESDRRFGVVRWDPQEGAMAEVGCCAEILQHQTQPDDRSNIVTLGQQRFRLLEVVREAPFKVGLVSWIEDDQPDNHDALSQLATEVTSALRDVVELTGKLMGKPTSLPNDLPDLPRELSFWIGPPRCDPIQNESSRGRSGRSLGREVGLPINLPVSSTTSRRAEVTSVASWLRASWLSGCSSSIQLTRPTLNGASRTTSSRRKRCCPRVTMLLRSSGWVWCCRISAQQPTSAMAPSWGSQRTTPKRRSLSSTVRSIIR